MITQTIAHYRIQAKIGTGGTGEVNRATHSHLGRDVALKVLPEACAYDAQRMGRFELEAKVLASLNHPNTPTRRLILLVMVMIAVTVSPRQAAAQSDPRSPTSPSDPVKVLVEELNDPKSGTVRRAKWNIDRAVWVEPVTAVRNGVTVLVTPAHADIHTSIDSTGAVWSPDGPLISAPHNPTGARLFIPRGYMNQAAPRRLIFFAPGGGATEYAFERGYAVPSPVLRRGFVLSVISAWSTVATPIPLSDWGLHLNVIAAHVQIMLVGLGLPPSSYSYAWGQSRGARFLAYASELTGTPFNGVIEERGGGDIVDSALEQIRLLNDLRAGNSEEDPVFTDYISKIGRRMRVTSRNGDL